MDKLFWSVWKRVTKKGNVKIRKKTAEMDTKQIQDWRHKRGDRETKYRKKGKSNHVLSLGKEVLLSY